MQRPKQPVSTALPPSAVQSPDVGSAPNAWLRDALQRMQRRFWFKTLGITAFMWVFFAAYFHLLRHPRHTPSLMPLTALDQAIGFQPWALAVYVSLWFYVGIAPMLIRSAWSLIVYGVWIGGLCITGLAVFYVWPNAVPPWPIDTGLNPAFAMLQGVDASGNACPSLHVATACFTAVWVEHLLRRMGAPRWARGLNALWFALIAFSTVAVKQHVVLDVIAGTLLGLVFALPSLPGQRGREVRGDIIRRH
jgi:membrane-associated phospholipid phosphatase